MGTINSTVDIINLYSDVVRVDYHAIYEDNKRSSKYVEDEPDLAKVILHPKIY